MTPSAARLLNFAIFVSAGIVAFLALAWASNTFLLETRHIAQDQVPWDFQVVVEEARVPGAPASFDYRRLRDVRERPLAAGESLHLSTAAHTFPGSCCYDFRVLEDGPGGQVIELNADDMSYLRSRYRVHQGEVTALAFRKDFSLYYLGYMALAWLLAGLGTAGLRRRIRARGQASATLPGPDTP